MNKIPHIDLNWVTPEAPHIPENFRQHLNLPDIVLETLIRRGIKDESSAMRFMDPSRYIPTPSVELPDLAKGVERTIAAVRAGKTIGVWGDFDVDGQTATSVLVSTLRHIGAKVVFHIPVRDVESHGIKIDKLQSFLDSGVDILITCDTGITAHEPINYAQSRGIDVIVTDHHLLPDVLPSAYALINPRQLPSNHPLSSLPGVGVAYKFSESLLDQFGSYEYASSLHDLVALGAIADLADLVGDTRYLVQSGLDHIRSTPRPSIAAMLRAAEIDQDRFSEEQVSFAIAPRLNAVGRLADANPMVDFLLSENQGLIPIVVSQIEELNARRKILCDQVFDGALANLQRDRSLLDQPILILDHPEWPAGVVGIVASRLVEMFHRPVILLVSPPGQPMRGSARSVPGIDITAALDQNQKLLLSYGGHPMAAGMSLLPDNYAAFKRGLSRSVAQQASLCQISNDLVIDSWISPASFSLELIKSFDSLAPFGPGNPPLLFAEQSMSMVDATPVGKTKEHLQVIVEDLSGIQTKLIWWNGSRLPLPEGKFDLAYTVHASNYRGQAGIQFEWVDFRQASESTFTEVQSKRKKISNHDYRNSEQPLADYNRLRAEEECLVWSEGTFDSIINGVNRNELHSSQKLILWSTPSNLELIETLIHKVKPSNIYWFLQTPLEHHLANFTKILARIIKNNINQQQNEIGLEPVAAQTALPSSIIDLGLKWLASEGYITLTLISPLVYAVKMGGEKDDQASQVQKQALIKSFDELRAFTAFLKRVDLDLLIRDLGQ